MKPPAPKDQVRYTIRVGGIMKRKMLEAQEVAGVTGEAELCRYLINRGLEAMSRDLDLHQMRVRLEKEVNAQELLPFVQEALGEGEGRPKQ